MTSCNHADFWFDRTLSYCKKHDTEEMRSICCDCEISICDIVEDTALGGEGSEDNSIEVLDEELDEE